jgi:hypothetical protein
MSTINNPERRRTLQDYERKSMGPSGLLDLIAVLRPHPQGLRRWSVMRAMRVRSERAGREVTPKFEDDIERIFRRHCAGDSVRAGVPQDTVELFFRPKDKAGEVWAVDLAKAKVWLGEETTPANTQSGTSQASA